MAFHKLEILATRHVYRKAALFQQLYPHIFEVDEFEFAILNFLQSPTNREIQDGNKKNGKNLMTRPLCNYIKAIPIRNT